ncbi:hypothetical protein V6U90_29010 [Micromonospora sp. CPCC 206060]|uniref:hypothetical protein n=1 Tax=Micromonospora sp. CPCC 206060 TaxID=3122406 RepID=UPI002FF27281
MQPAWSGRGRPPGSRYPGTSVSLAEHVEKINGRKQFIVASALAAPFPVPAYWRGQGRT